jgi:hypothetical protein
LVDAHDARLQPVQKTMRVPFIAELQRAREFGRDGRDSCRDAELEVAGRLYRQIAFEHRVKQSDQVNEFAARCERRDDPVERRLRRGEARRLLGEGREPGRIFTR